jgi:hypothetical protein
MISKLITNGKKFSKAIRSHELLRHPFLTPSHTSAYVSIRQYMSASGALMNFFLKSDPSALVIALTKPLIPLTVVQPTDQVQLSEVSGHHLESQENASMNVSLSYFHPISLKRTVICPATLTS